MKRPHEACKGRTARGPTVRWGVRVLVSVFSGARPFIFHRNVPFKIPLIPI